MNNPSELDKACATVGEIIDKRLQTALDASKPIPTDRPQRRVTIDDHQRFRETLDDPHKDDDDLAGLLADLRAVAKSHYGEESDE